MESGMFGIIRKKDAIMSFIEILVASWIDRKFLAIYQVAKFGLVEALNI